MTVFCDQLLTARGGYPCAKQATFVVWWSPDGESGRDHQRTCRQHLAQAAGRVLTCLDDAGYTGHAKVALLPPPAQATA